MKLYSLMSNLICTLESESIFVASLPTACNTKHLLLKLLIKNESGPRLKQYFVGILIIHYSKTPRRNNTTLHFLRILISCLTVLSAFLPACLPSCLPHGFGFAVNELEE